MQGRCRDPWGHQHVPRRSEEGHQNGPTCLGSALAPEGGVRFRRRKRRRRCHCCCHRCCHRCGAARPCWELPKSRCLHRGRPRRPQLHLYWVRRKSCAGAQPSCAEGKCCCCAQRRGPTRCRPALLDRDEPNRPLNLLREPKRNPLKAPGGQQLGPAHHSVLLRGVRRYSLSGIVSRLEKGSCA